MAQNTSDKDQLAACSGSPACVEVTSFVATVTDFRRSTASARRVASVTMRFRNKTNRPLVLGYMLASGLATDDRGNRYEANGWGNMSGLPELRSGYAIDPKFVVQPGESNDARLELYFQPGSRDTLGTRFTVDLTVREIDSLPSGQWRLGREHALEFRGLGEPPAAAPPR
jgi:hypothetical protein